MDLPDLGEEVNLVREYGKLVIAKIKALKLLILLKNFTRELL